MRTVDRPSWRFAHGNGQVSDLHEALFARDAAALVVPPSSDVPPALASGWLARESWPMRPTLSAAERAAAGHQWLAWWRQLLAVKVSLASGPPLNGDIATTLAWAESLYSSAAFDEPEFASLASAPELQAMVRAAHQARPRGLPGRSGSFQYQVIRRIAEQTAADFSVPTDAIDGRAHVLDVRGTWWHVAGPGCVLCSPAATTDAKVAEQLLRAVFVSRLPPAQPE
jgi:hypothetical protein